MASAVIYQSPSVFYHAHRITPWLYFDLAEADLSADSSRAGCAYFDIHRSAPGEKTCHFLARYGRFVTTLHVSIYPDPISEEEMIQVVQKVDEHMGQCVDLFGDAVWEEETE